MDHGMETTPSALPFICCASHAAIGLAGTAPCLGTVHWAKSPTAMSAAQVRLMVMYLIMYAPLWVPVVREVRPSTR